MRRITIALLLLTLSAGSAGAQTTDNTESSHRAIKVMVGIGALVVGTVVAAKSSQTTTVSSSLGRSETSSFSSSQLITGLAIASAGGILLWDGLRSHEPSRPTTFIGLSIPGQRGAAIVWKRSY